MRLLAVDVGSVRVGLAASDELGILASPLPAYGRTESIKRDARCVAQTAEELGVEEIVVGLPKGLDNRKGAAAEAAEEFAARIGRYTRIPITMWDERLTSTEAQRRLQEAGLDSRKARGLVDSQAAVVLLESYMRARAQRRAASDDAT